MPFFEDAPLVGRQDTLSLPDRIPVTRGVYAWFFRETARLCCTFGSPPRTHRAASTSANASPTTTVVMQRARPCA